MSLADTVVCAAVCGLCFQIFWELLGASGCMLVVLLVRTGAAAGAWLLESFTSISKVVVSNTAHQLLLIKGYFKLLSSDDFWRGSNKAHSAGAREKPVLPPGPEASSQELLTDALAYVGVGTERGQKLLHSAYKWWWTTAECHLQHLLEQHVGGLGPEWIWREDAPPRAWAGGGSTHADGEGVLACRSCVPAERLSLG